MAESPSPSPSVSPSVSPSPSPSRSPSASNSPSPSPSVAPEDAVKWGDNGVEAGVENVTWRRWQTSEGVEIEVSGDPDWGDAKYETDALYSPVTDTGDALNKLFTVTLGTGAPTIYVRGQAASFDMFDADPAWEEYTDPVAKSWRYVQVALGEIGWTPPFGIPDPPFGITEEAPAVPNPWTSEVEGFYYVNYLTGTDSGRTYGYPSAPRQTIPSSLPAGSVVEVHGATYDQTPIEITASGTSGNPVWIRGETYASRPSFTATNAYLLGSYVVFENIKFYRIVFLAPVDHAVLRHCEVQGDLVGGGTAVASWSAPDTASYCVLWDNYIHDCGDVEAEGDQDCHAIAVTARCSNIWIVNNEMARCSGDGCQVNGTRETTHHIYLGKNLVYDNKQSGLWAKESSDVIFSQNTVHGMRTSGSSLGQGLGNQYGPDYVWYLFNHVYDCEGGIVQNSESGGSNSHMYVIGNLIHDIVIGDGPDTPGEQQWICAISLWAGTGYHYVIGNTIWDYKGGIYTSGGHVTHIENNILGGRNHELGRDILFSYEGTTPGSASNVRNNVCPATGRYQSQNSTVHTSLAAFDAVVNTVEGNYEENPDFVSVSTPSEPTDDFRLQVGAPGINHALNSTDLTTDVYALFYSRYGIDIKKDLTGEALPDGGSNDIGAYQG